MVTFAPAIGPTIGGYLTENYGWQTIFFINTIPSIGMMIALWVTLERQPMQLGLLKEGDWAGIVTMTIGLSSLQTLLEEGNKDDWFSSPFIVRLAVIAVVFLSAFIWIELTVKKPLVDLRLLQQPQFRHPEHARSNPCRLLVSPCSAVSAMSLPQYLALVQGYNAEQIGEVLAWTGLPQIVLIPLDAASDERNSTSAISAFVGIALFAISCFMNITMSLNYSGDQFFWPNVVVRAIGHGDDHRTADRHRHHRHRAEGCRQRFGLVQHAA